MGIKTPGVRLLDATRAGWLGVPGNPWGIGRIDEKFVGHIDEKRRRGPGQRGAVGQARWEPTL